jgi:hypothetical protein
MLVEPARIVIPGEQIADHLATTRGRVGSSVLFAQQYAVHYCIARTSDDVKHATNRFRGYGIIWLSLRCHLMY